MACQDCLENCDPIIGDKCIRYTGDDIPLLGISTNSSLFEVENQLVTTLLTLIDGTGITLSDLTLTCPLITNLLGQLPPTIPNLVQVLINANCSLQAQVTALGVNPSFSFNTGCLTGTLSTRDQILQAVILQVCATQTAVAAISADYVKASDLPTLVTNIINNNGNPAVPTYSTRMVPSAPIPYIGPLSNFDNTGSGIASLGFANIYLMNGLNGTQDWRGRSPIGAIQNVPGGTLDSAVDPSLSANAGFNYTINQKVGQSTIALSAANNGPHTHTISDPGHSHGILTSPAPGVNIGPTIGNSGNANSGTNTSSIQPASTNITINSSGTGIPIPLVQPSIGTYFIIYLP
jgi:hypothetical protein